MLSHLIKDSCEIVLSVFIELFIESPSESMDISISQRPFNFPVIDAFFDGDARLSRDMLVDLVPIFRAAFLALRPVAGLDVRELSLDEMCLPLSDGMLELV